MAMNKVETLKTVLIILVLNIILPTADVATDLILIDSLYRGGTAACHDWTEEIKEEEEEKWRCGHIGPINYCSPEKVTSGVCGVNTYSQYYCIEYRKDGYYNYQCSQHCSGEECTQPVSHPKMATAMLMPFSLNYIICFITFFRLGTDKKKTFIFPLLNLYPQFEAARLILAILRDPQTGMEKKRLFEQNIGLHETFIEAVPTTLILTFMWASIRDYGSGGTLGTIIFGAWRSDQIVDGTSLFILTFILSCFSACLGLAKCLKNGVARPIAPGGPVDGLLSGRFILAFTGSACCLVMRGLCFASIESIEEIAFSFVILFLPQLLLAIFSTLDLSSRNSLKILISHPSLILLPVFTFFTFSKIQCCGDRRVKFSVRFTLINIAVTVVGLATGFIVALAAGFGTSQIGSEMANRTININRGQVVSMAHEIYYLTLILICLTVGIFSTISFLYMDRLCCYCCSCFLSTPQQLVVYDPDQPENISTFDNGIVVPS